MKPLIAIVGSLEERHLTSLKRHVSMVSKAGGTAGVFEANGSPEDVLEVADGLLLVEGPDVHPSFYGNDPSPKLREVDAERDEFEVKLAKLAIERGIPVMGVDRGMHVINVALGGTLYQDIYEIPKAIKHDWSPESVPAERRLHTVRIKVNSLLYAIMKEGLNVEGTNEAWTWVNSFHHQAVKKVGDGLRPVAFSVDGLVEAIEGREGFVLGVQWRPEHLPHMLPLYRALVNAAAGRHEELEALLRREIEAEVREEIERELARERDESRHSSDTSDSLPDTSQT